MVHVHDYAQMPVACRPGLNILVSDLVFQASYMATRPVRMLDGTVLRYRLGTREEDHPRSSPSIYCLLKFEK